jgi:hypothetical protein
VIGFRLSAQQPPEPRRVNDAVVMRFEHVYEVDPALMRDHIRQHDFPAWETRRIVAGRWDHLAWMHAHWADTVLSGEQLLAGQTPPGDPTSIESEESR